MLKSKLYIEKLTELNNELRQKNFNLDSWKLKAMNNFRLIFGTEDRKIKQLEEIHYDYSSWALRDSSGGKNIDKVLETAHAIIDSAIFEVNISKLKKDEIIQKILNTEQFKELMDILNAENINQSNLESCLQKLEENQKINLLQALLTQ